MVEKIVNSIVGLFGLTASGLLSKYIVVFAISLMPILELRGGLIAASLLKLNPWLSLIISIVGNLLPIPFILLLIEKILNCMKKTKHLKKIALWLEKKADKKKGQLEKYGYIGLLLFVGIPLPGTGAWTGSLIASLLHMVKKKSFLYIIFGILLASLIMMFVSFGLLSNLIK